jgi:hypothetical protein
MPTVPKLELFILARVQSYLVVLPFLSIAVRGFNIKQEEVRSNENVYLSDQVFNMYRY